MLYKPLLLAPFLLAAAVLANPAPAVGKPTITATAKLPGPSYAPCGGNSPNAPQCPEGYICIDNPRVPGCGLACDRPGICVFPVRCGGFAGFPCEQSDQVCIDDPRDDCDPKAGGNDCIGICV